MVEGMNSDMNVSSIIRVLENGMATQEDRAEAYANLQELQKEHRCGLLDEGYWQLPRILTHFRKDSISNHEETATLAIKCAAFFVNHRAFASAIPEEEARALLLTWSDVVTSTSSKLAGTVAVWSIGEQAFKPEVIRPVMPALIRAAVYGLDNPMGSTAITYEAARALQKLARVMPAEMRFAAGEIAPPLVRRLLSANKREREIAETALQGLRDVLLSPPANIPLIKLLATEVIHVLLPKMLEMVKKGGEEIAAIVAWGWFVRLLGIEGLRLKNSMVLNRMLSVMDITFISSEVNVRLATQVAWRALMDTLLVRGEVRSVESADGGSAAKGPKTPSPAGKVIVQEVAESASSIPHVVEAAALASPAPTAANRTGTRATGDEEAATPQQTSRQLSTCGNARSSADMICFFLRPLVRSMKLDKDAAIRMSCMRTWKHLLAYLGEWVHDSAFFALAVEPMLNVVLAGGPNEWPGSQKIYGDCLQVLESRLARLPVSSPSAVTAVFDVASPLTAARLEHHSSASHIAKELHPTTTTLSPLTSGLQPKPMLQIEWEPWCIADLPNLLPLVECLLRHEVVPAWLPAGMPSDVHLEGPASDGFEGPAFRLWRLIVKGVESVGRGFVRPTREHVVAVEKLLHFVADHCGTSTPCQSDGLHTGHDSKGGLVWEDVGRKQAVALPIARCIVDILVEELRAPIVASSFYRLSLPVWDTEGETGGADCIVAAPAEPRTPLSSASPKISAPCQPAGSEGCQELVGQVAFQEHVTPIAFLTAVWLRGTLLCKGDADTKGAAELVSRLVAVGTAALDWHGNVSDFVSALEWVRGGSSADKAILRGSFREELGCAPEQQQTPQQDASNLMDSACQSWDFHAAPLLLLSWARLAGVLLAKIQEQNEGAASGRWAEESYRVVYGVHLFVLQLLADLGLRAGVGGSNKTSNKDVADKALDMRDEITLTTCSDEQVVNSRESLFSGLANILPEVMSAWVALQDSAHLVTKVQTTGPNVFLGGLFRRVLQNILMIGGEERQSNKMGGHNSVVKALAPPSGIYAEKDSEQLNGFLTKEIPEGGMPGPSAQGRKTRASRLKSGERRKVGVLVMPGPLVEILTSSVCRAVGEWDIANFRENAMLAMSRKKWRGGALRGSTGPVGAKDDSNHVGDLIRVLARMLVAAWHQHWGPSKAFASSTAEQLFPAVAKLARRFSNQSDALLLLEVLKEPLERWLACGISKYQQEAPSAKLLRQIEVAWGSFLNCLNHCDAPLLFDSALLASLSPLLSLAFRHPCNAIVDRTLTFWTATFGSLDSSLSGPGGTSSLPLSAKKVEARPLGQDNPPLHYPPALFHVLTKLRQKVNISLPFWPTESKKSATPFGGQQPVLAKPSVNKTGQNVSVFHLGRLNPHQAGFFATRAQEIEQRTSREEDGNSARDEGCAMPHHTPSMGSSFLSRGGSDTAAKGVPSTSFAEAVALTTLEGRLPSDAQREAVEVTCGGDSALEGSGSGGLRSVLKQVKRSAPGSNAEEENSLLRKRKKVTFHPTSVRYSDDGVEYEHIPLRSPSKSKGPLTEHQREVRAAQRGGPSFGASFAMDRGTGGVRTHTNADFSQSRLGSESQDDSPLPVPPAAAAEPTQDAIATVVLPCDREGSEEKAAQSEMENDEGCKDKGKEAEGTVTKPWGALMKGCTTAEPAVTVEMQPEPTAEYVSVNMAADINEVAAWRLAETIADADGCLEGGHGEVSGCLDPVCKGEDRECGEKASLEGGASKTVDGGNLGKVAPAAEERRGMSTRSSLKRKMGEEGSKRGKGGVGLKVSRGSGGTTAHAVLPEHEEPPKQMAEILSKKLTSVRRGSGSGMARLAALRAMDIQMQQIHEDDPYSIESLDIISPEKQEDPSDSASALEKKDDPSNIARLEVVPLEKEKEMQQLSAGQLDPLKMLQALSNWEGWTAFGEDKLAEARKLTTTLEKSLPH